MCGAQSEALPAPCQMAKRGGGICYLKALRWLRGSEVPGATARRRREGDAPSRGLERGARRDATKKRVWIGEHAPRLVFGLGS